MSLTKATRAAVIHLLNEGVSQREIARRLNIPKSTLHDAIKDFDHRNPVPIEVPLENLPEPRYQDMHTLADWMLKHGSEIQEVIDWWQARKTQRAIDSSPRKTSRQTYHVDIRYIQLIRQEADEEGCSIMEVVNRIFQNYFEGKRADA